MENTERLSDAQTYNTTNLKDTFKPWSRVFLNICVISRLWWRLLNYFLSLNNSNAHYKHAVIERHTHKYHKKQLWCVIPSCSLKIIYTNDSFIFIVLYFKSYNRSTKCILEMAFRLVNVPFLYAILNTILILNSNKCSWLVSFIDYLVVQIILH